MFGSKVTAAPLGQRPLRYRAAAWLAVLAFGFAQFLLGTHVHAETGAHEPQEPVCAVCAFTDDGQLSPPSPGKPTVGVCPCLAQPCAASALIQSRASALQPRAPPSF